MFFSHDATAQLRIGAERPGQCCLSLRRNDVVLLGVVVVLHDDDVNRMNV
jgi:hypothetical protein